MGFPIFRRGVVAVSRKRGERGAALTYRSAFRAGRRFPGRPEGLGKESTRPPLTVNLKLTSDPRPYPVLIIPINLACLGLLRTCIAPLSRPLVTLDAAVLGLTLRL